MIRQPGRRFFRIFEMGVDFQVLCFWSGEFEGGGKFLLWGMKFGRKWEGTWMMESYV